MGSPETEHTQKHLTFKTLAEPHATWLNDVRQVDLLNGIEEVVGSIPSGSTTQIPRICGFSVSLNSLVTSGTCPP